MKKMAWGYWEILPDGSRLWKTVVEEVADDAEI